MAGAPEKLVIFGAGGHARVVLEAALSRWPDREIAVLDDDPQAMSQRFLGHHVRGSRKWLADNWAAVSVMPALGRNDARAAFLHWLEGTGRELATVIDRSAVISPSATIGAGAFIAPGAVLNAQARIGRGAIVNTSTSIDHDCVIGDCAHIGPGVHLCGNVIVGSRALLGVGCSVIPGIRIGADAIVGAGSTVIRDLPDGARVAGTPARPIP